eukprot:m.513446 g.513446  ORF g.513446 m.513446 type:complete len:106 (-) comp21906_c1_seq1:234-551(-)
MSMSHEWMLLRTNSCTPRVTPATPAIVASSPSESSPSSPSTDICTRTSPSLAGVLVLVPADARPQGRYSTCAILYKQKYYVVPEFDLQHVLIQTYICSLDRLMID